MNLPSNVLRSLPDVFDCQNLIYLSTLIIKAFQKILFYLLFYRLYL